MDVSHIPVIDLTSSPEPEERRNNQRPTGPPANSLKRRLQSSRHGSHHTVDARKPPKSRRLDSSTSTATLRYPTPTTSNSPPSHLGPENEQGLLNPAVETGNTVEHGTNHRERCDTTESARGHINKRDAPVRGAVVSLLDESEGSPLHHDASVQAPISLDSLREAEAAQSPQLRAPLGVAVESLEPSRSANSVASANLLQSGIRTSNAGFFKTPPSPIDLTRERSAQLQGPARSYVQSPPKVAKSDQPRSVSTYGTPYTTDEDELLVRLKEIDGVKWVDMPQYFNGRSRGSLQVHYCTMRAKSVRSKHRGREAGSTKAPETNAQYQSETDYPRRSGRILAESTPHSMETEVPRRAIRRRANMLRRSSDLASQTDLDTAPGADQKLPHREIDRKGTSDRRLISVRDQVFPSTLASLLRQRTLGVSSARSRQGAKSFLSTEMGNHAYDTLGPSRSYTGTSGDASTVAWSPDGNVFAVGSVATSDDSSMQYNRRYNLLLGDHERGILKELPEHNVPRPRAESGANASSAMHESQDSHLFMTVQMVQFSPDGTTMYSAGCDSRVRGYDTTNGVNEACCVLELQHKAESDLISVSNVGLLATGARRAGKRSIKIIGKGLSGYETVASFSSEQSIQRKESRLLPSCLTWGVHPWHTNYLLAGFASNSGDDVSQDKFGELCLWEIERKEPVDIIRGGIQSVFDCAWNPNPSSTSPLFAAASVAGSNVNRGTRSVIRTFSRSHNSQMRAAMLTEMECPALDVNDVVFNPYDPNLISTGCTDGKVYLWDARRPNLLLHTLVHDGEVLMELDKTQPRESIDTGIRFLSWGENRTRLFSGSSDGILKMWNPYLAPEDALVQDVNSFTSGVMSGAFSPDFSKLLIGEVNGTVSVLEVDHLETRRQPADRRKPSRTHEKLDPDKRRIRPFKLWSVPTPEPKEPPFAAARELVNTNQIEFRPMGSLPIRQAVQGPAYRGPYSSEDTKQARKETLAKRKKAEILQEEFASKLYASRAAPGYSACSEASACTLDCVFHPRIVMDDEETKQNGMPDSGRSLDRIPQAIRSTNKTIDSREALTRGLTAICTRCSTPARRLDADNPVDLNILCERCGFECFRGCGPALVSENGNLLECDKCGLAWRANVLGYELLDSVGGRRTSAVSSENDGTAQKAGGSSAEHDDGHGHVQQDLVDYYHGLWRLQLPTDITGS
ncbi:hypothetical protein LTR66_010068 [Elasticomyces elasticus]|nr:hypothetical protein LTR66_010068 [Elasticomyces elasticus]